MGRSDLEVEPVGPGHIGPQGVPITYHGLVLKVDGQEHLINAW